MLSMEEVAVVLVLMLMGRRTVNSGRSWSKEQKLEQ